MNALSQTYGALCSLIARLFPGQVEVVLHDLETGKIAAIQGGISNRAVGDESLVEIEGLDLEVDEDDIIGPYPQTNWDGDRLKSYTLVLRNGARRPVGLLCVNLRTAAFSAAADLLAALGSIDETSRSKALFAQDWREAANQVITQTLADRGVSLVTAKRDDKVALLGALERAGVLEMRGSADYAAKTLGMSRASVYNLLKDARSGRKPADSRQSVEVA